MKKDLLEAETGEKTQIGKSGRDIERSSPPKPGPGIELSAVRRLEVNETCPVCRESSDSKHALTCVNCRARYHLGCIAESKSRRCATCQSKVYPPARLHVERIRRSVDWRPTLLGIVVGTVILFCTRFINEQNLALLYFSIFAFVILKAAKRQRDEARQERLEQIKAQRVLFDENQKRIEAAGASEVSDREVQEHLEPSFQAPEEPEIDMGPIVEPCETTEAPNIPKANPLNQ